MIETCQTCVYWTMGGTRTERIFGDTTMRECHANPPTCIIEPTGMYKSLFPLVRADDHCGVWDDGQAE